MKKKLQVFISSTYIDLIEERQAAVQAVLDAGHIPAGMELFKAGNNSQLETIKKWIDASDVYMLILGGRYGSIEELSEKSYTQVEYEYALEKGIPVFAVILNDQFLFAKASKQGKDTIFEVENLDKYEEFKAYVMTKIIRPVEDAKDIKLAIHTTLAELLDEYDLVGWVKGDCITNDEELTKENKCLAKENLQLIKKIQLLESKIQQNDKKTIGDFTFDELINNFENYIIEIPKDKVGNKEAIKVNALKFYEVYYNTFCTGISNQSISSSEDVYVFYHIAPYYLSFALLERTKLAGTTAQRIQTSKLGAKFYSMLKLSKLDNDAGSEQKTGEIL